MISCFLLGVVVVVTGEIEAVEETEDADDTMVVEMGLLLELLGLVLVADTGENIQI